MSVATMNILRASWDDENVLGPDELRVLIARLKKSVESGEMQQWWPVDAPFATGIKISDIDENSSWPADYIEWYFISSKDNRHYKLTAETYHGAGGHWTRII